MCMNSTGESLHNVEAVYQIIALYTFSILTILLVNYASVKLERKTPPIISPQLCYKMLGYSGKFFKAPIITFISKARKHRKLGKEEQHINASLPSRYLSCARPVLNRSLGFQMRSDETVFINKQGQGSKSKCEQLDKLPLF